MDVKRESLPEHGILLTHEGQPNAVIVVPAQNGNRTPEMQAASLLQTFIKQMSGATLEVVPEDTLGTLRIKEGRVITDTEPSKASNFIVIGTGELSEQLGVTPEEIGPGGIRLKTFKNAIVLLGGPTRTPGEVGSDDGGLQHAAIELLEQLGCRYLWPGELGLVIPSCATLKVKPLDIRYTPQIRSRGIRIADRLVNRHFIGLQRLEMTKEKWAAGRKKALGNAPDIRWDQWQRLGGSLPRFGHAGAGLRNAEQHLKEHPEWFAQQGDGSRDQRGNARFRLCKSNPELIAHVANDIIKRANENPDLELVSLDPNDGGPMGFCMCDQCKALDPTNGPPIKINLFKYSEEKPLTRIDYVSLSDRMVYYWNSIAERVTRVHPNLLFGISAYSCFTDPPVERKLHPNLVLRYVPSEVELFQGWKNAGAKNIFWRPNILLASRRDGKLRAYVTELCEKMQFFADAGIRQTDFDSIMYSWSIIGINNYAAARLVWNPKLTAESIITDFATAGFGAGAAEIKNYLQRIETLTTGRLIGHDDDDRPEPLMLSGVSSQFESMDDYRYTPQVVAELRTLLNVAEKKAEDPIVVDRIAFLRMGLNFTELQETLDAMSLRAQQGEAVDQALAQRLIDLNCLTLRDIVLNHNITINTSYLTWGSGTFARFKPIRGRTVKPSDEALLERVGDPNYGLTGREDSIEEMLKAFGL